MDFGSAGASNHEVGRDPRMRSKTALQFANMDLMGTGHIGGPATRGAVFELVKASPPGTCATRNALIVAKTADTRCCQTNWKSLR